MAILNFYFLGGKVQDSDLAHFLEDGKLSEIKPFSTDADAVMAS